ncbi:MAG: patatin-like phospholipase family protein [Salibacteraceae bacterium]
MKKALFFLFCVGVWVNSYAQETEIKENPNRPKIGLVLSGGGAKGFAHIGVIKLLEEVGIVPDYVTGTSMGSIVGGLYAMGYSPDELQKISDTTEWSSVLSNVVPLTEVTFSEKPYYGSFLTELNINKSGVSLPGGLIEGQSLLELLSVLSRPVHGIDDFHEFPIPFTCVATDIVNGVPVGISKGNITDAIRASMAIPTAFTPVEYDSLLLIDGGWTRNLPVKEAKDMGADIIISVDVGAPLKTKDELQSMISILDQTAWLLSVQDTEEQLKMSDIVVTPPVGTFSTFAFEEADTIIQLGYNEAAKYRGQFEELANKVYGKARPKPAEKPFFEDTYIISDIQVKGTRLTSDKFVKGRLRIDENKPITVQEVAEKIGLLYGSLYYKKIGFELVPQEDSTQVLHVNVVEDNPAKLKLSFYYDSENSIGINLNTTLRNLVLKNSRLIMDLFLSENPILGLKYLKYMGLDQQAFVFGDFRYTKDSDYLWQNLYGQEAGFSYNELVANFGMAYTFNNKLLVSASIGGLRAKAKPTTNSDTIVDSWLQNQTPLRVSLIHNTFNRTVFPTKGLKIHAFSSYNANIKHTAKLKSDFDLFSQETADSAVKVDPYFMIRMSIQHYIPITPNFSFYWDGRLEMGSENKIGFNEYSKVGGIAPILNTGVPYWGLKRNEINISQLGMLSAGFQWRFMSKTYLKAKVNYLNSKYPMAWFDQGERDDKFELYGETYTELFGLGMELAYDSPIGPLRLVLHKNQYNSGVHMFVGIGYNIYKSDGDF